VKAVICVCTYRRPDGLKALLHSLTQLKDYDTNDLAGVEIVVIDNDAAGEGAAVCHQLPQDYPFPVHAQVEPQAGISPARNSAVSKALTLNPDVLAFLDDDEQPSAQWLSELLRIQKTHNADIVGGPTLPVFPDGVDDQIKSNSYYGADLGESDGAICQLQAAGNFLIKADVIQTMGPTFFHPDFAKSGGEDLAFFTQLAKQDASMRWAANATVYEPVPPGRLTEQWMRSRIINIHNSRVRVMRMLEPGLIPALIRGLKTCALGGVAGLSSVFALAVPSRAQQARMLRWKFWGKLSAHLRMETAHDGGH